MTLKRADQYEGREQLFPCSKRFGNQHRSQYQTASFCTGRICKSPLGRQKGNRAERKKHAQKRKKLARSSPTEKKPSPSALLEGALSLWFAVKLCVPHGPINTAYLPLLAIHPPATSAHLHGLSDVLPTRAA